MDTDQNIKGYMTSYDNLPRYLNYVLFINVNNFSALL